MVDEKRWGENISMRYTTLTKDEMASEQILNRVKQSIKTAAETRVG